MSSAVSDRLLHRLRVLATGHAPDRWKLSAALFLRTALAAATVGVALRGVAMPASPASPPAAPSEPEARNAPLLPPAVRSRPRDCQGDPLPDGAIVRLGTTRFRHDDHVEFVAYLPGGKRLLSFGNEGAFRIWELPGGKELRRAGRPASG